MSFLEMLDVVNEGLIAQGRGSDRVRLGLPRGHLRHLRLPGQRRAARARCAARRCASCTCAASRTATRSRSSRGAPRPSRVVKDLVVDRSAFDRIIQAGGYTSINVGGAPDANAILIAEARSPSRRWTRPPASAAAPAWRPARTPRRRSSRRPRSATSALLPQGQVERRRRVVRDGRAARRRRVRQLLERRRMRGGLPEGNLDHQHRADEPRVLQGDAGLEAVTSRPTARDSGPGVEKQQPASRAARPRSALVRQP